MPVVDLDALRVVQEHDLEVNKLRKALSEIPLKYNRLEKLEAAEKEDFITKRKVLQEAEVAERESETKIKGYEEKILKLRNQQLTVKKNDEYQAIEKEIAHLKQQIGAEEEAGLELIDKVEEATAAYAKVEATHQDNLAKLQTDKDQTKAAEAELKAQLEREEQKLAQAREETDPSLLTQYEQIKNRVSKGPWLVAIEDHKCCGCHIRVSNEAQESARHHGVSHCSNCGRMIHP